MLLKRFLTKREALLTASIGVFVLIELWTSPRRFFDANNCNNDSSVIMKHQEYDPLWQFIRADSKEIRKWGCNRTETPTIFVHIGKSGGGSVGARIAAASFNYTKMKHRESDGSYYPLDNNSKARFIASSFTTHLPSAERTYEGTSTCHASTPLGQAIGCPELLQRIRMDQDNHRHGECNEDSDTCHLVYQGHNFFGSELHWLPAKYLRNWWNTRWSHMPDFSLFWSKLVPNHTWCLSKNISRPVYNLDYKKVYEECSIPLQRQVDTEASHALVQQLSIDDSKVITSWSPLYASLPVLRVTVMRDPFSWLVSKYFWHRRQPDLDNNSTCDNINEALLDNSGIPRPHELDMDNSGLGWLSKMSLGYIMYLCGEDCIVRYAAGTATLQDLELQAEGNLRQSFAVVGLLEEVDTFYEMLTARIQYVNTSLNPQVRGDIHHSGGKLENVNCKTRFNNPNFRARLLASSPELRVINRLYQVAKEVNRFQLQELRQCSPSTFAAEEPTMD
jgi:hypothetical protein